MDNLFGFRIRVLDWPGIHRAFETPIRPAEHDPRMPHRLQRVPGYDHLCRRIRPELQMQPRDGRSLDRIQRLPGTRVTTRAPC